MLRRLTIVSLMVGLFSTGLLAAEKDYEPAKKPGLTLKKSDLSVIEKATKKNFKGLTTKEKELLLKYLKDYAGAAKHEKKSGSMKDKKMKDPVKPKNPTKMMKKVSKK